MKTKLLIFMILTFLVSCKENKEPAKKDTKTELIDNLDLNNSIFPKNELQLKKYKFENTYIENIYIENLLDKEYRQKFFNYLKNVTNENDFKETFFCKLLLIRIQQLKDSNSYYLLIESSNDIDLSYNGIELLYNYLIELFLEDPYFFVKQSIKYNDKSIVEYIMLISDEFLVNKAFLDDNMGYIEVNGKQLLLNHGFENDISDNALSKKLKVCPKVKVIFSPSFYSGWENKTIAFTNIIEFFDKDLINKFNKSEANFYNSTILPVLNKYIIQEVTTSVYSIYDPDGYTNLRKDKNAQSQILQKIKTGERIEVLDSSGDWFLIKSKEGKEGYIHKSRIKSK